MNGLMIGLIALACTLNASAVTPVTHKLSYLEVNTNLNHLDTLLKQASSKAIYKDKKLVGYEIDNIKKGSLFDHMNLKNKDVITELDGKTTQDPLSILSAINEVKQKRKKAFTLLIERQKKPVLTKYEIK